MQYIYIYIYILYIKTDRFMNILYIRIYICTHMYLTVSMTMYVYNCVYNYVDKSMYIHTYIRTKNTYQKSAYVDTDVFIYMLTDKQTYRHSKGRRAIRQEVGRQLRLLLCVTTFFSLYSWLHTVSLSH